jgi:hypothetical protein
MRKMCGKEEEENRERYNPSERQQQWEKILKNQSIKILFERYCLHTPRFHQSSYSNYGFFYSISIPFRFLFRI